MALTSDQTTPEIEWPVISVKAEASELCDWTFDYFTKTSDEQLGTPLCTSLGTQSASYRCAPGLSEHIFDILELITTFRINRTRLRNFFVEVRKLYKDNPYHNFQHAFSVLHMVFLFVTTTSAKTMLTRADILALTVGAIGHDVGHPGMNNDFLINTYATSILFQCTALTYGMCTGSTSLPCVITTRPSWRIIMRHRFAS